MEEATPHLPDNLSQRTLSVQVGAHTSVEQGWVLATAVTQVLHWKVETATRDFTRVKEEMTAWGQVLLRSAKSLSVESEASRKSGLVIWPESV